MPKGRISKRAHIYPGVKIGKGSVVEDFVIIGCPAGGMKRGGGVEIGDGALIRSHTIIYAGNKAGRNFQTGHGVMIRESNTIGDDVSIGTGTCVEHHVKLGDKVRTHSGAFIPEYTTIDEGAWIGPNVVITNVLHPWCPKAKTCVRGAHIKRFAKIGANSTLCPDITIGEHSLVGAGSVVVKDVPARSVACGSPAKVIKRISQLGCRYGLIDRPYED